MKVVRTIAEARDGLAPLRAGSVGLVPTMGSLHEGHLALLDAARAENDTVVMSLFVNPAQFGDASDLSRYPRDEERDLGLARGSGADLVFAPSTDEMYPSGFQTWVDVTEVGAILEGRFRPGHFRGVATVVLKLLNVVRPTRVYFGQKDAQQVEVIRRLIADLALEVQLRAIPTVRDADGLALSSRNACSRPLNAPQRSPFHELWPGATVLQPSPSSNPRTASRSTISRSPTSTHPFSPARFASVRHGSSTTCH